MGTAPIGRMLDWRTQSDFIKELNEAKKKYKHNPTKKNKQKVKDCQSDLDDYNLDDYE